MVNRRPLIVLGSLITAMTFSSGVLLVLEPGPINPPPSVINLSAQAAFGRADTALFDTSKPISGDRWKAIVVYESGSLDGFSIGTDGQPNHREAPDYHFLIRSDHHGSPGTIQRGFRWNQQKNGACATGPYHHWYNQNSIGICLMADSNRQALTVSQKRSLITLIHRLQQRFHIRPGHVLLQRDVDSTIAIGKHFPVAWFRGQLLADTP